MNPACRITAGLFLLLTSSVASATPSRVAALGGNAGMVDDTDFIVYPTETSTIGQSAWFHYDGSYTGAISWDGNAVVAGLGSSGGWDMRWTNSHDTTGYAVSASYLPDEGDAFTLGGAWGSAERSDGLKNLSIGGNVGFAVIEDETAVDVSAGATSRSIGEDSFSSWAAGAGYAVAGEASDLSLGGQYFMGPRMGDEQAGAALSFGAMALVAADLGDDGSTHLYLALPASNLAGEFAFNDWLVVRGSVIAAVLINHDGEDVNTAAMVSGSAGMGFVGEHGGVDVTFNPDWALAGPYFFSGTASDMVGSVTARFEI